MSIDPTYYRESLEGVITALRNIRTDARLLRQLNLFAFDIDQAIPFMEENLDAESLSHMGVG